MQLSLASVQRLTPDGLHNAFTSLAVWQSHVYCAWRQAQSHDPVTLGRICIARTPYPYRPDAAWDRVACLHTGGDDRDPKLLVVDETTLAVYFGTTIPHWGHTQHPQIQSMSNHLHNLQSHMSFTRNGIDWGQAAQIGRLNYWYWSIVPHPDDTGWMGFAYQAGGPDDGTSIHVNLSDDLVLWRHWAVVDDIPFGQFSEPLAWAPGDGTVLVVYRHGDTLPCRWARSDMDDLTCRFWHVLPEDETVLHPGALLPLSPVTALLAGRAVTVLPGRPGTRRRSVSTVRLWHVTVNEKQAPVLTEVCTMPSGGDCGYPGLCWADDTRTRVLCSYYSQHDEVPQQARPADAAPLPLHQYWYPHRAGVYLAELAL